MQFRRRLLIATLPLAWGSVLRAGDDEKPATADIDPAAYRQVEVLMRAMETARENYIDGDKVTYERLVEGALEGMFARLDEHSQYINPTLLAEMRRAGENPNNTAGIKIEAHDGGLLVAAVAEGGPAARAGLKVGDRLLAIDGEDTDGLDLAKAAGLLDGAPGKSLTLEYMRPGSARARAAGFRREQPVLDSVTGGEILDGEGPAIGYVRVREFEDATPRELADALDELADGGMRGLVIDLRGNPGGVLDAAVELCAQFLPADTVVARTKGREGTGHSEEFRTLATDRPVRELPLALLVDGQSASSSEIVAGALKDHGRATLVGEKTYGKGSVQTIVQMGLDTGAAMRRTTARFFTPKGKPIDKVGVAPDIRSAAPLAAAAAALRKTLAD